MTPSQDPPKPAFGGRALRWAIAHPVLAGVLVVASMATAAITVTYTNTSTFTTSVTPPPIQFLAGDDASPLSDYVTALTISGNKTYLTTTVKGVPESTLTVESLFKITNVDDETHTVTLSTTQVTNAFVTEYEIDIMDGAVTEDTLDFEDASPSAQFTLIAGETFEGALTLTLDTGAGVNNVALSKAITLTFT